MLIIKTTKEFERNLKLCAKRQYDLTEIQKVIELLINEKPLDTKYRNHKIIGNWAGCLELHIKPDWLLIYEIDKPNNLLILRATGTHSDLF